MYHSKLFCVLLVKFNLIFFLGFNWRCSVSAVFFYKTFNCMYSVHASYWHPNSLTFFLFRKKAYNFVVSPCTRNDCFFPTLTGNIIYISLRSLLF